MSALALRTRNLPVANQIGFFAALVTTLGGIVYFLAVLSAILSGKFTFPPGEALQLFAGIIILVACPAIVVMFAGLYVTTPPDKKIFTLISLGFTLLFALAVSINRFSQLGVVRQATIIGKTDGIGWFLAYGDYSIMLGIEYLGWTWFLGLAMLSAAPVFSTGRLEQWIRSLMVAYGALGIISSVGFLTGSWLSVLGFVAWGIILFLISALLMPYFQRPVQNL